MYGVPSVESGGVRAPSGTEDIHSIGRSMHDALYQRLVRKIESLPDEQIYQVLDYIEFLESKYSRTAPVEASGLQKFAENLEDKLRRKAVSPNTIREAFQLISAADRVVSSVSEKGRRMFSDLSTALEPNPEGDRVEGRGDDRDDSRDEGRDEGRGDSRDVGVDNAEEGEPHRPTAGPPTPPEDIDPKP
jgi:hypothetical protein